MRSFILKSDVLHNLTQRDKIYVFIEFLFFQI